MPPPCGLVQRRVALRLSGPEVHAARRGAKPRCQGEQARARFQDIVSRPRSTDTASATATTTMPIIAAAEITASVGRTATGPIAAVASAIGYASLRICDVPACASRGRDADPVLRPAPKGIALRRVNAGSLDEVPGDAEVVLPHCVLEGRYVVRSPRVGQRTALGNEAGSHFQEAVPAGKVQRRAVVDPLEPPRPGWRIPGGEGGLGLAAAATTATSTSTTAIDVLRLPADLLRFRAHWRHLSNIRVHAAVEDEVPDDSQLPAPRGPVQRCRAARVGLQEAREWQRG